MTPETLTEGSLKAAYRDLVKKYHPDTNRSPDAAEKFRKVKKVYAYLQEELRRKECSRSYASDNRAFAVRRVHGTKKRGVPIREQPLLFWNKPPSLPIKIKISKTGNITSSCRSR